MNEGQWNLCTKTKQMLRFLLGTNAPRVMEVEAFPACKASDRKLRLFACTCYDRFRGLLTSPLAQAAVEVAEQFAEGVATSEELQQAHVRLQEALDTLEARWQGSRGAERRTLEPKYYALVLALHLTRLQAPRAAYYASSTAYFVAAIPVHRIETCESSFSAIRAAEERAQADLLREIVGPLPFRPVRLDAAWLTGTVVRVAEAIYAERCWGDMGVLGDALEEAGCTDEELLSHCRGPGPHTRACWLVDALLGKS